MKIVRLTAEQFDRFSRENPYTSFEQTSAWGQVKENVGWRKLLLGYENEHGKILAGGCFLGKKMPFFNKYLYYCPHGYLIDFHNRELWENFHRDLLVVLKKEKAFELILDPYVLYQQRDINGAVKADSFCNQEIINTFLALGFTHSGFNLAFENLQPRFHFRLPLTKSYVELENEFKYEAKRRIRKKDYLGIRVRELGEQEIAAYKQLMEMTAQRRGFIDRPLSYYQNMYRCLHPQGILRYMAAEIDFTVCQKNVEKEIAAIHSRLVKLQGKGDLSSKTQNRIHEETVVLEKAQSLLKTVQNAKAKRGEKALLSVVCLLTHGQEAVMLLAGNDEDYLQDFNTSNIIVGELIKRSVEEGYSYYNFYGISGNFNPENELYGLYSYKKQYGGEVCEYIGQFEITLDSFTKFFYEIALKAYKILRKKR